MEVEITWDKDLVSKLQVAYDTAIEENKEIFSFNGKQFVTTYAKYLLEHLKTKV